MSKIQHKKSRTRNYWKRFPPRPLKFPAELKKKMQNGKGITKIGRRDENICKHSLKSCRFTLASISPEIPIHLTEMFTLFSRIFRLLHLFPNLVFFPFFSRPKFLHHRYVNTKFEQVSTNTKNDNGNIKWQ